MQAPLLSVWVLVSASRRDRLVQAGESMVVGWLVELFATEQRLVALDVVPLLEPASLVNV